jgi:hypothetical protein
VLSGCPNPIDNPGQEPIKQEPAEISKPEEITAYRIEISETPSKTVYRLGEIVDFTGLEVKIIYSDGTEKPTSDYRTDYDTFTAGIQTVTVIYMGGGGGRMK